MNAPRTKKPTKPFTHRWTRDEYFRLSALGGLAGQRVELIKGKIIDMPAQLNAHVWAVEAAQKILRRAFGKDNWVRAQATLSLGPFDAPEPDVAVVPGAPRADRDYPTAALLVVEVSDTTLWYDRNRKVRTYARAGIAEYWIVNLVDRQVEVFRDPFTDPARRLRHGHATEFILRPGDAITPLAAPRARIAIARLLPRSAVA